MDEAIRDQIDELNRCRADYAALFQNFKQARAIFEEKDQLSNTQLQIVQTKNEALERKIDVQKQTISAQKLARKGFENDVNQLKYASDLLEIREKSIHDKHEGAVAENLKLREEIKNQSEAIIKLKSVIQRLNSKIAHETVPKVDVDRLSVEINAMRRVIHEEMVTVENHQQVKEKYAALQNKVEWGMVALNEYKAVETKMDSLTKKLEGSVTRIEFAELLDKYQNVLAEKLMSDECLERVSTERDNMLRNVSECRSKFLVLESLLDKTEKDLIEAKLSEERTSKDLQELRYDAQKERELKERNLDRNRNLETANVELLNQLENMKLLLDKELKSIRHLENALKELKEKSESEKSALRSELENCKRNQIREVDEINLKVESEQTKSAKSLGNLMQQHKEELELSEMKFNLELDQAHIQFENVKVEMELKCAERLEDFETASKNQLLSTTEEISAHYKEELSKCQEQAAVLEREKRESLDVLSRESHQCLQASLLTLQRQHSIELTSLEDKHQAEAAIWIEKLEELKLLKRQEEINCDLERIRANTSEAKLTALENQLSKKEATAQPVNLDEKEEEEEEVRRRKAEKEKEVEWEAEWMREREKKHRKFVLKNEEKERERDRGRERERGLQGDRANGVKEGRERDESRERGRDEGGARGREFETDRSRGREESTADNKEAERIAERMTHSTQSPEQLEHSDRIRSKSGSNRITAPMDISVSASVSASASPAKRSSAETMRHNTQTSPLSSPLPLPLPHTLPLPVTHTVAHTASQGALPITMERSLIADQDTLFTELSSSHEKESRLLEITRSLEGCTFGQLIHMAAKGALMNMNMIGNINGNGRMNIGTELGTEEGSVHGSHSPSHAISSSFSHTAPSSSFMSTFHSPIRHTHTYQSPSHDVLFNSTASPNMSTRSTRSMSHISHSPGLFLPSFDTLSSPRVPDFAVLQQLRTVPTRGTAKHLNGMDVNGMDLNGGDGRTQRGDSRGELEPDSRTRGTDLHSTARRASSAGRRGGSREGRYGRDRAPPHLSTSPVVAPYHSLSHKANDVSNSSDMTAAYRAAQTLQGLQGLPGGTGSGRRPFPASPSDSSREELLDRLISLTKEAKVKSPLGISFEDFEPL